MPVFHKPLSPTPMTHPPLFPRPNQSTELQVMDAPAPTETRSILIEALPELRESLRRGIDWDALAAHVVRLPHPDVIFDLTAGSCFLYFRGNSSQA